MNTNEYTIIVLYTGKYLENISRISIFAVQDLPRKLVDVKICHFTVFSLYFKEDVCLSGWIS